MGKPCKFGFDLLNDDNYATWRVQMKGLLATKDCLRAISEAGDQNSSKAMGLLIMCVEEQNLHIIERSNNAMEAWNALAALYRQTSTANLVQLRRQLTTLEKKADESVQQYVARARCIADQIRAATGNEVEATDLVVSVLAGLPSEYNVVRTVIENMAALPSLAEVQAKLLLVERQFAHLETTGDTAFYTKVEPARRHGRFQKAKVANQVNFYKDTECWYCKELGHVKRDCPKREMDKQGSSSLLAEIGL
jgi:hypothetical protein